MRSGATRLPLLSAFSPAKLLAGIVLLSALLRLFSALYQGNGIEPLPGVHDQVSYHTLAGRILEGKGFTFGTDWWPATKADEPTAHWSFFYTLYLAAVYLLFGVNPLAARIIQALAVAILHPWLSWRIGKRLFGETAGLVAAVLVAGYGYFIYYGGALVTESFYIVAILWTMDSATKLAAAGTDGGMPGRRKDWLLLGVAVGTTVLLRQVFLFFTPFLLGFLAYALRLNKDKANGYYRRLATGLTTVLLVLILMVLPWTLRNYRAFDHFVLLNTNAGFAFFWGNHPVHGSSFIPILREGDPSYGSLIPRRLRGLDEAALDRALLEEGIGFVIDDPGRYLLLSLSRAREFFKFWPSSESGFASNAVRVLSFGILCPLMAMGVVTVSYYYYKRQRPWNVDCTSFPGNGHLLLLLFATFYTIMHLLSWTLVRYRLPVDGVLVLYAAAGIVWLVNHRRPLAASIE